MGNSGTLSQTTPRSIEQYPAAIGEDFDPHHLLNDSPVSHRNQSYEELETLPLCGRSTFLQSTPSDDVYALSTSDTEYEAPYFNDEDLFHRLDDEYDYPHGVDEEDDAYGQDIFDDHISLRGDDIMVDLDGQIVSEEEIDLQYFDASDLCDQGDLPYSEYQGVESGLDLDGEVRGNMEEGTFTVERFPGLPRGFAPSLSRTGRPRAKSVRFSNLFAGTHSRVAV